MIHCLSHVSSIWLNLESQFKSQSRDPAYDSQSKLKVQWREAEELRNAFQKVAYYKMKDNKYVKKINLVAAIAKGSVKLGERYLEKTDF